MIKFKANQKCRYFDVLLDKESFDKHFKLLHEFADRGVINPRGGGGAGFDKNNNYRLVFWLDESVADEYIRRMKGQKQ